MRKAAAGYTLTELTLVMALLATLASMAMASLGWVGSFARSMDATRVRTALVYAQEWAQATTNATWVAFDVPTDTLVVHVEDPANPGKAGRLIMTDPLSRSPMILRLGAHGTGLESASLGSTSEVQFDARGTPHDANGIPLAADGTVAMTGGLSVRVTRGTGLVKID